MATTLAILTADVPNNAWLRTISRPLASFDSRIVVDKPDVSFRAFRTADVIMLGPDVSRLRRMMMLRALTRTGVMSPALAVISPNESTEQVLGYLQSGASAVILDTDGPGEFMLAVEQVRDGRLYLSSSLIPAMLRRYRALCAESRRNRERDPEPPILCCRSN